MDISFGVQGGPLLDRQALVDHARSVEVLGYRDLWSMDHLGLPDPFLPLMAAVAATDRLRFGPLVINNELHHPVLLARTTATFAALSGSRVVLGLGTGYQRSEHDAAGIELRPPGPRVDRFGETLPVLRSLLDGHAVDHRGDHLVVSLETLGIEVPGRVPILVGGHGRRVVSLAGRHADIFQFTGLVHDPVDGTISTGGFDLAALDRRAGWLAEAAGDRIDEIERSALVQVTQIGDDAATIDAAYGGLGQRTGLAREVLEESPFVLVGSQEQVVDKIGRLGERLGITHYVVRDPEGFAPVVDALATG